jgi:Carboxypeptidase regulatory-like domain/TonB dependent receptor-like, beta-barrel
MSKRVGLRTYALLCLAVATFLVLFVTNGRLWAQAQTATITGTATDTSGAALAGAKIQVTNVETNVSQSTVTDAQGRFTVPDLPVGTYSVQASQSGFQTTVHTGVTLTIGQTVVVDLSLPVGQVSQTVSVEANVSQVETQTTQISNLVSPEQVQNLPLNGRNIEQLLTLTPGVQAMAPTINPVTGRMYGMQNNYSISGARPTGQMFLLDGTDIRDFWEHGIGSGYAGTELGISSISQFQVITSNGNSQYAGNGIVSEVSKSGTNALHGDVYEYFRNNKLDARDTSDPLAGPPPFRQNQFGADLGGPIKKDKLFYFGNYEGLRNTLATANNGLNIVEPYVATGMLPCYAINGDVVNLPAYTAGSCPAQPATVPTATPMTVGDPTTDPILAVPGLTAAAALPESMINLYKLCTQCKLRSGLFNGVPEVAGLDQGGYYLASDAPTLVSNEDYILGRVDYTLSSADTLFGRYVIDDARVSNGSADPLGIFVEKDRTRNQYFTAAENHIVSPTMVNVLRFGYVRTNESQVTPLGLSAAQMSAAGVTSDPLDLVRTLYADPLRPDATVTPGVGTTLGPNLNRPGDLIDSKFSGGDDLSWTHGSHTLKIGGVVTRVDLNVTDAVSYGSGESYGYSASNGFAPSTFGVCGLTAGVPNTCADSPVHFLQGLPSGGYSAPPGFGNSVRYFREIDMEPYFQDDWRVTSNLTLNLGLRYDYTTNPVGWAGAGQPLTVLTGSFNPPVGPQAPTPSCANPASPGYIGTTPTLLQAAVCALSYYTPVKHVFANNPNVGNWQPRFGIAYSPFKDNKTAIRAGFGVFVDPTAARIYESGFTATPPAGSFNTQNPAFPNAYITANTCSFAALTCPTPSEFAGVTYQNTNGSPYTLQYNFNIQQQLTPGTVLTVAYSGSVARHLWGQRDINPPECATFPDCTALPSIPTSRPTASSGPYTVTSACSNAAPQANCYGSGVQFPFLFGAGGTEITGPRINPVFGSMVIETTTSASSYSSLQAGLNHQFSKSLSAQVNYTYSHCIDNGSFATSLEQFSQLITDPYNQSGDYENCDFDVRHNLSINGIYSLPFKGNRLVSGWQIATIAGIHSGMPINVTNELAGLFGGIDPANLGTEWSSRPNYSYAPGCHPNQIVDSRIRIPGQPGSVLWFNPNCYEPQAPGFLGNVRRNSVPGPGAIDLDLSILKNTKITEKVNMQFRAEAFNIMNHFNPGAPGSIQFFNLAFLNINGVTTGSQSPIIPPRQIQFALKFSF